MKKTYVMIVLIISSALLSCTDNLEKDPIGLLTLDQVESNPTISTLETSVLNSYQPLTTTMNVIAGVWQWSRGTVFRPDVVLSDMAANDMLKKWNPDGDQPWMDEVANLSFTAENGAFNGIWVYNYEGIARVNIAISFLGNSETVNATGMSEARKNELLGQAFFLRAFYYFDLLNNFGGVPLFSEPLASLGDVLDASTRATADQIRDQVNADLTKARTLLTDTKYADPAQPWRVSKGAVIALQAKVALYIEDWGTVLSLIGQLDGLGFYGLNPNYFDSFDVNKEFIENEDIFVYDHVNNTSPDNSNGIRRTIGWGFIGITDNFLDEFEANDPRLLYTVDVDRRIANKIIGSTTELVNTGNKIYIRYADVLLWKAEALNKTGDYTGAVAIINEIRKRARTSPTADGSVVPSGTLPDRGASTNPSEIMGWLMHERRVELGFESHRFNDLKRWGTAASELLNFQDKHNLYPIPQEEIDKTGGAIAQNPGY